MQAHGDLNLLPFDANQVIDAILESLMDRRINGVILNYRSI